MNFVAIQTREEVERKAERLWHDDKAGNKVYRSERSSIVMGSGGGLLLAVEGRSLVPSSMFHGFFFIPHHCNV